MPHSAFSRLTVRIAALLMKDVMSWRVIYTVLEKNRTMAKRNCSLSSQGPDLLILSNYPLIFLKNSSICHRDWHQHITMTSWFLSHMERQQDDTRGLMVVIFLLRIPVFLISLLAFSFSFSSSERNEFRCSPLITVRCLCERRSSCTPSSFRLRSFSLIAVLSGLRTSYSFSFLHPLVLVLISPVLGGHYYQNFLFF